MSQQTPKGRIALYTGGILLIILTAGYFIAQSLIRKKIKEALKALPPAMQVTYSSLQSDLFSGSLVIKDLKIRYSPDSLHHHQVVIDQLAFHGIRFFGVLTAHRLHIASLRLEGCRADLDDYLLGKNLPMPTPAPPFNEALLDRLEIIDEKTVVRANGKEQLSFEGSGEIDTMSWAKNAGSPVKIGGFRLLATQIQYVVKGAYQRVQLKGVEINSRESSLRIDTARIHPTLGKEEVGKQQGFQADVVEATSEGIRVEQLDITALSQHRLVAGSISVHRNNIYIFRDRRLARQEDKKPLPMNYLESLPLSIRVGHVKIGTTTFTYEEFPARGNKTGTLKIVRMTTTLSPLISRPTSSDPAYCTLVTEGSLMGSGSVTATTKMPLRKGEPYKVEGAFHDLDVTTLNSSAENLGRIHLESGLLNSLSFRFDMTEEQSTGEIIGEYHNLVVDKLKENSDKKDKLKSFALKKFIIPRNKDHTLAVSKRTGRVSYKRDPTRNFSYYLLHSLLVGVKSSFSLGFLLPG